MQIFELEVYGNFEKLLQGETERLPELKLIVDMYSDVLILNNLFQMRWLIAFTSLAIFSAIYIIKNFEKISIWLCGYTEVLVFAFIVQAKRNWFGLGCHAQLQIILLVVMIPAIVTVLMIVLKIGRFLQPRFIREGKGKQRRSLEAALIVFTIVIGGRIPHYIWHMQQALK